MLAPSVIGRWPAAISQRSASGRSWAKDSCTVVGLEERLGVALGRARIADEVEHRGRVGTSSADPEPPRIWNTVSPSSGMKAST